MAAATNSSIIITGPESTGKSTIAFNLAEAYNGICIPEYARDYIAALDKPYGYADIEHIAMKQYEQWQSGIKTKGFVFFDTLFIITKVWFLWVYKTYPAWLDESIDATRESLYLLCAPDIPWQPDTLRENGGEARIRLFQFYEQELNNHQLNYYIVQGEGIERINHAKKFIDKWIKGKNNE